MVDCYYARRAKASGLNAIGWVGDPAFAGYAIDQQAADIAEAASSADAQLRAEALRQEDAFFADDEELDEISTMASNQELVSLLGDALG